MTELTRSVLGALVNAAGERTASELALLIGEPRPGYGTGGSRFVSSLVSLRDSGFVVRHGGGRPHKYEVTDRGRSHWASLQVQGLARTP